MSDEPLFTPRGADFLPTEHTRGPWDPRHQHGGADAGLHVLEGQIPRPRFAQRVEVLISRAADNLEGDLAAALQPYRHGPTPVMVHYQNGAAQVLLRLGASWQVSPSTELLAALDGVRGIGAVRLRYR